MNKTPADEATRVAVYYPHLSGGGAEQIALSQAAILAEAGYAVDLVLDTVGGRYGGRIPAAARVMPLAPAPERAVRRWRRRALSGHWAARFRALFVSKKRLRALSHLPAFVEYLQQERPALVIANLWSAALVALFARACVMPGPRVIGVFHGTFFRETTRRRSMRRHPLRWRHFFALCRHFYSQADALVTVSDGVGRDLIEIVGVPRARVRTLPNPVVSDGLFKHATEPVDDPWADAEAGPLVVAVGRLSPEKNYLLLLDAMARVRAVRPDVRLAVLGEGRERERLEARRDALGLGDCVALPGWADNPHAWMKRSALVVLSSDWEGLSMTLIEAMACGCPVVATDCPHGPREILDHGRYGRLVPVGDRESLAQAIVATLDLPRNEKGPAERAQMYSFDAAGQRYRALVAEVLDE